MEGFALVVRFTLEPGHEDSFDALVAETLDGIRSHEPGTLVYTSHRVDGEPAVRIFYELYRDRAAFEEHERQPHTRRFLAEREQHVAAIAVDFLHLLDGKATQSADA
ncbi:MAG: antibiotic biosynthesis monooxygenase [Actinomycetota bacterium]|nr:antibiotic biosynthesis monooxygenase [Actinomycetota bacterium]